jgi:hypothetical protein
VYAATASDGSFRDPTSLPRLEAWVRLADLSSARPAAPARLPRDEKFRERA